MITKKLLSIVEGGKVTWIGKVSRKNMLHFKITKCPSRIETQESVHDIANKCRLWALSQGYSIETRPYHEYDKVDWLIVAWEVKIEKQHLFDLYAEEYEAIFAVCEWVRKELLK